MEPTNELYRVKAKLNLMAEDGCKQLLMDVLKEHDKTFGRLIQRDEVYIDIMKNLRKKYLLILDKYKKPTQNNLFNGQG